MKEMWMEALGKRLNKVINQYKYPPLTPHVITPEICTEWRSILSGLPSNDEALRRLMTQRLLKSTIEEIEDRDDYLVFSVSMLHQGERYLVQLQLKNLTWKIDSIHFVEQVKTIPMMRGLWIVLALVLLMAANLLISSWLASPPEQAQQALDLMEETTPDDSAGKNDFTMNIDELEAIAKEKGYILVHENEYERAIQEKERNEEQTGSRAEEEESPSQSVSTGDSASKSPIKVTIKSGSTSTEVVQLLAEHDLIRSEKEAHQLLRSLGLEHRIRAGTYTIPAEATYMEIFNIITH